MPWMPSFLLKMGLKLSIALGTDCQRRRVILLLGNKHLVCILAKNFNIILTIILIIKKIFQKPIQKWFYSYIRGNDGEHSDLHTGLKLQLLTFSHHISWCASPQYLHSFFFFGFCRIFLLISLSTYTCFQQCPFYFLVDMTSTLLVSLIIPLWGLARWLSG